MLVVILLFLLTFYPLSLSLASLGFRKHLVETWFANWMKQSPWMALTELKYICETFCLILMFLVHAIHHSSDNISNWLQILCLRTVSAIWHCNIFFCLAVMPLNFLIRKLEINSNCQSFYFPKKSFKPDLAKQIYQS